RISRRDAERVAQILIALRKLVQAYQRASLPPVYQKKPYLAEALDFIEIDLFSRGLPVETLQEWRREDAPVRPSRIARTPFGAGGFIGGQKQHRRDGRPHREGGGEPQEGRPPRGDHEPRGDSSPLDGGPLDEGDGAPLEAGAPGGEHHGPP